VAVVAGAAAVGNVDRVVQEVVEVAAPGDQGRSPTGIPEMGEEGCLDCCYYNHDHVDGWECRKKGKRSKDEERRCWEEAAQELSRCQRETCNRYGRPPIITTAVPR
jgi:hypothetical protein